MISNQTKSINHIKKLKKYISSARLENIPRNQFGRCNKQKVLISLGIKGSKDHPEIINIFRMLDKKLGKAPEKPIKGKGDERHKELQNKINELEKRLALLSNELSTYKKHDGLIKHLIETGALVK